MTLIPQQIAHFEMFGYVLRRQLFSPDEITAITGEFEQVLQDDLQDRPFTGQKRYSISWFVEKRPRVWDFLEDDRIYEPIRQLLGPDFIWLGSDANLCVGYTAWHRDAADVVTDQIFDEAFGRCDRPRIRGMVAKLNELGVG